MCVVCECKFLGQGLEPWDAIIMVKTKEVQGAIKLRGKLCFKQIPEDGMEGRQSKVRGCTDR